MKKGIICSYCGRLVESYKNPIPTVDCIIELPHLGIPAPIVLIRRKNAPLGWAIPGGFIDYGESAEEAAVREALEETGLEVSLIGLLGVYSDPKRDERFCTISAVFVATASRIPIASDDADYAAWFQEGGLPEDIAFDHEKILADYFKMRYRIIHSF